MHILIADAEGLRAKGLAEACMASGYSVERVAHGAAALELALERLPELMICPLDLPMIDGGRLAEILRSNPRTRDVSFLFLVKDELDAPVPMDPRDGAVVAPWHKEAVLEHIDAVVERGACLGPVRSETEMEGKLSQITVGDLLQLFQMNHKSGTVRITREGASAPDSVLLRGGQVVDASVALADGRSIVGEKALFRILSWEEGRFEFVPGETPEGGRIRKPMRALLLEGLGQLDEWEKRRHELPANDARLRLQIARERLPAGVHPRTLEVLDAVEACGRVGDIVDRCALPDYQVLRVLADLMERECLAVDEPATVPSSSGAAEDRLFTPTQVRRVVIKVIVINSDPEVLRGFYRVLSEFPDFHSRPRLLDDPQAIGGLATLGHFPLRDGLSLRLVALPSDASCAPLWDVAAHGMLGAIILPSSPYGAGLEATEAVFARLCERHPGAVLHLLLADSETLSLEEDAREKLDSLEGGTVFVLPAAPSPGRLPVLRNLFARLVP
jgi:CheY-like chemotaxis protein